MSIITNLLQTTRRPTSIFRWTPEDEQVRHSEHSFTIRTYDLFDVINIQMLFDHRFVEFMNGDIQFPFPGPYEYSQTSLYPRVRPFRADISVYCILRPSEDTELGWIVKLRCNCGDGNSLFCQSLRELLFHSWKEAIQNGVRAEPFPVDLGPLTSDELCHCAFCTGATPLELISEIVQHCHNDGVAPLSIENGEIILRLSESASQAISLPCFMHYMQNSFPYPTRIHTR
ncbi:ORF 14 [Fowl aviadenovirus 4]|uniref:ORF 14 n=1 Tax=Fowl aviadenovirus 4 TaxID=130663 RepID=A0A173ADL1_FADV4|nr:ORF 14 [Fowl aviadenovirus 4]